LLNRKFNRDAIAGLQRRDYFTMQLLERSLSIRPRVMVWPVRVMGYQVKVEVIIFVADTRLPKNQ
jgi:hypothetical protein